MSGNNSRTTLDVTGMTCAGCEMKIERILSKLSGVSDVKVSFSQGTVTVAYDDNMVSIYDMSMALEKAGYVLDIGNKAVKSAESHESSAKKPFNINQILGIAIVLFAVYFVISKTVGFNFIPEITPSMGYGVLFLVGILTSLHCVAMCGGINMAQCVSYAKPGDGAAAKLKPSLLYNLGRVISYTIVGGLAGALGSAVSFSGWARGIVAVASGIFMVIMGLSMLGIFPWLNKITPRMPRFLRGKAGEAGRGKGPLIVGLVNGLMPCGPLQAMQLYALGTGSFLVGATSMLVFSLGTVPLMFGLGALSSLLSSKFTSKMMKVSAALVLLLGLVMVNRGLALSGVSLMPSIGSNPQAFASSNVPQSPGAAVSGGVQNIEAQITSGGYPEITVQKGIPVRLNLKVKAEDLNGCNRTLVIQKFNKQVNLKAGDNIIEFTPTEEGTIPYSCWMGMITSRINVVAAATNTDGTNTDTLAATANQNATASPAANDAALPGNAGSCCAAGSQATKFAGGKIPVDEVAIAKVVNGIQEVTITVNNQGYTPAVAVVQKGIKTKIKFVAEKLNSCNSYVTFPALNGALDLAAGKLETPVLTPETDFTFECGMGMLHGYIKVVDDIKKVNIDDVKKEISQFKPATNGGSCCGS